MYPTVPGRLVRDRAVRHGLLVREVHVLAGVGQQAEGDQDEAAAPPRAPQTQQLRRHPRCAQRGQRGKDARAVALQ